MGINVWINEYTSTEEVDPQADWWDTERYGGDEELVWAEALEWDYFDRDGDGHTMYKRPKCFDTIRTWVNENIESGHNKKRWTEAIDRMEADDRLWIEVCA